MLWDLLCELNGKTGRKPSWREKQNGGIWFINYRNGFGAREAVELAGDQTFMKSAKTSGSYFFVHF